LNAGASQNLHVAFTPTDTANYNNASKDVTINVLKGTPVITWANPIPITYPTALSATQLNASADVAGSFAYTPSAGTVLSAGNGQTLHVAFTPTDTANYNGATKDITIDVNKGTPVITWANPLDIAYGVALSGTQLNASASVPGSLVYTPAAGTVLNPGASQALTVNFTPADTANYNAVSKTVYINVGYGVCSAAVGPGGVILPPINSDGTSVYQRKGGSTIPVKFRVCSASGASISNPAAVFSGTGGTLTMLSAVRGTIANINEADGTDIPDVAFRWDGQQWIFNMATTNPNLTSGSTYAFRINLAYAPASITFVVGVK
jgi:hypothetical protein